MAKIGLDTPLSGYSTTLLQKCLVAKAEKWFSNICGEKDYSFGSLSREFPTDLEKMSEIHMKKAFITKCLFYLLLLFFLTGCALTEKPMEKLSEHYKQNRDYESLVALIPYLNYTMYRSDVQNLLGPPVYCPTASICYYLSDKSTIVFCQDSNRVSHATCQSFILILVVNYDLIDKTDQSQQDRLQGFSLSPVGE